VDVHEGTWEGFWSMITGGDHLSVRNVVPTLTSSKRQGLSLDGWC
jgi:hypothetical protein